MAAQLKFTGLEKYKKIPPGIKESNSDRLRKLALPNCHLVEAVLKEHYHIFNKDCRERLKKLLEVILTANGGKGKFDKFDESFKRHCIENLKLRLQTLEREHRKKEEILKKRYYTSDMGNPGGDHIIKIDDSNEMQVLFKASSEQRRRNASSRQEIAECGDHSENEKESYKTPRELKTLSDSKYDKLISEYVNIQDKPSGFTVRERRSVISENAPVSMDAQMQDIDQIFAEYKINLTDAADGSTLILHERQSKVVQRKPRSPEKHRRRQHQKDKRSIIRKNHQEHKSEERRYLQSNGIKFRKILCDEEERDKGKGDGVPVKKKKKKHVAFKDPPISIPKTLEKDGASLSKMGDIPSLAVRYYVALIADMKRNSVLYDRFIKEAIKPTDSYKQPYINAAYNCWMDYFSYNICTLDNLQPYIKNLVKMCKEFRPGHPKMRVFETTLPLVLINSVKNIRPWRRALEETIECCKHLTKEDLNTVSLNVHQLYVRYHKKIDALNPTTSEPIVK